MYFLWKTSFKIPIRQAFFLLWSRPTTTCQEKDDILAFYVLSQIKRGHFTEGPQFLSADSFSSALLVGLWEEDEDVGDYFQIFGKIEGLGVLLLSQCFAIA